MKQKYLKLILIASLAGQYQVSHAKDEGNLPFTKASDIPAPEKSTASSIGNAPVGYPYSQSTPKMNTAPTTIQRVTASQTSLTLPVAVAPPEKVKLDADSLKQQTVHLTSGGDNQVVNVSTTLPNRISTPFRTPSVLGAQGLSIAIQIVGQDVFISNLPQQPIGLFIREDESVSNNSPVAALTLVPKAIPGQNINLVFDHVALPKSDQAKDTPSDYQDGIRVSLTQAVSGVVPDGFGASDLRKSVARLGDVLLTPIKLYSGSEQNIYVYDAQDVSGRPIELNEPSFYHDGVRAVAIYPNIHLMPNQHTNVFIVADIDGGATK